MKVRFKVGKKVVTMKVSEVYGDGSVRLIDGERLRVDEIIEYLED